MSVSARVATEMDVKLGHEVLFFGTKSLNIGNCKELFQCTLKKVFCFIILIILNEFAVSTYKNNSVNVY